MAGDIVDGEITKGMSLHYHLNGEIIPFEIIGIEVLDVNRENQVSYPALVLNINLVTEKELQRKELWLGNVYECK